MSISLNDYTCFMHIFSNDQFGGDSPWQNVGQVQSIGYLKFTGTILHSPKPITETERIPHNKLIVTWSIGQWVIDMSGYEERLDGYAEKIRRQNKIQKLIFTTMVAGAAWVAAKSFKKLPNSV